MATLAEKGRAGTWFYSGDPSSSNRDWVRWRIGDVNATDQLVSDQEIAAAVTEYGSKQMAAARVCEAIAAEFSREADVTLADGSGASRSRSLSQKASAYMKLARDIARGVTASIAAPFVGGISIANKDTYDTDSDRVDPAFTRGMTDYE